MTRRYRYMAVPGWIRNTEYSGSLIDETREMLGRRHTCPLFSVSRRDGDTTATTLPYTPPNTKPRPISERITHARNASYACTKPGSTRGNIQNHPAAVSHQNSIRMLLPTIADGCVQGAKEAIGGPNALLLAQRPRSTRTFV